MKPSEIFKEHFEVVNLGKNEFMCKYCQKKCVKHITRMTKHFIICETVPSNIKEKIFDDILNRANLENDSQTNEKMDISERDALWEKFARAVYTSGTPFSIVENKYWIEFFRALKPSFDLPNRKNLASGLLDAEYCRVTKEVEGNIKNVPGYGIQIDSWSNIRYEPIANVVVTTPEPLLYRSNYTKTEHHTGEFYATEIKKAILECGKETCFSVCTDNASAMVKSWDILQADSELKDLPISFYGCAAHTENLLATDLLKQPTCEQIKKKITKIITTINGSQVLKEQLKEIQAEIYDKSISLLLPVKTRWCYIVNLIQSVLKARESLMQVAKCFKVKKYLSQKVRDLILDERLWIEADQLCFLLQPIKIWISYLESDVSTISKVPQLCQEIYDHLESNLPLSPLTEEEQINILNICKKRSSEIMRPIHYASNILDPQFKGSSLNEEKKLQGYNYISEITRALKLQEEAIRIELSGYMNRTGFWGKQLLWDLANELNSPRVWWTTVCSGTALCNISAVILSMPPTSAATERTFSLYSNIHTKKRNRLSTERAGKIVYIARNLQVFHKSQKTLIDEEEMDFTDDSSALRFVDPENFNSSNFEY